MELREAQDYPMWAIGLELVIPALLLLLLWRIWPKETDDAGDDGDNDATSASPDENSHDNSPR
ncbi:MAG TPA: hypothetical protein VFW68_13070 [Rhodocyclaceae bacterium]|nr:hypothetical protein [Rhodocyclaceae bacterium]